jgi:hypothetical protein
MSGREAGRRRRRWLRNDPDLRESVASAVVAGAVAAVAGLTTLWVARLFLAREPLPGPPGPEPGDGGREDRSGGGA